MRLQRDILSRRQYPSMKKARKQWNCQNCAASINRGDVYEHSLASRADQAAGISIDIHLCATCATEVPSS